MNPSTLRLALDIGPLYGHRTGVGVAVAGMLRALQRRDDVAVDGYLVSVRTDPASGHRKLPIPGIVASYLWSKSDRPSADRWLGNADVVHGTNYVAPPSTRPTIISVYDCWFLEHSTEAAPLVRRAGQILRRAVSRGAWIHASSEATARHASELLGTDRIATVHLGTPPTPPPLRELARPQLAATFTGRPFILAIGTEERRKDLSLLIEAFDVVANRSPDPVLVLAGGTGDDTDLISRVIASCSPSVRDRIHRLGRVDDTTKYWLLRQASILAYPSLDEGFGFPILEAQSAGTPVVARNVGAVPEIAGEGGHLVTQREPEAFAEALMQVLHDAGLRLSLISAGTRNLKRFDWDATAVGLIDLYHRAKDSSE